MDVGQRRVFPATVGGGAPSWAPGRAPATDRRRGPRAPAPTRRSWSETAGRQRMMTAASKSPPATRPPTTKEPAGNSRGSAMVAIDASQRTHTLAFQADWGSVHMLGEPRWTTDRTPRDTEGQRSDSATGEAEAGRDPVLRRAVEPGLTSALGHGRAPSPPR